MKSPAAHNATIKTLKQILKILDESPRLLREFLQTRLDDLGDPLPEETSDERETTTPQRQAVPSSEEDPPSNQPDRMPEKWKKVCRFIGRKKGEATHEDIRAFILEEKLDINPASQRSQLAEYVNNGILRRVRKGVFELTESGAKRVGYEPA